MGVRDRYFEVGLEWGLYAIGVPLALPVNKEDDPVGADGSFAARVLNQPKWGANQSRSNADFNPSSTLRSQCRDSSPIRLGSFDRPRVVPW